MHEPMAFAGKRMALWLSLKTTTGIHQDRVGTGWRWVPTASLQLIFHVSWLVSYIRRKDVWESSASNAMEDGTRPLY